jgi:hypothetical protein
MELDPQDYKTLDDIFPFALGREVLTRPDCVFEGRMTSVHVLQEHLREEHTGSVDEPYWAVTFSQEFCTPDCPGVAHKTGVSDEREGCFCAHHVHRSAWCEVRKFPDMFAEQQSMM